MGVCFDPQRPKTPKQIGRGKSVNREGVPLGFAAPASNCSLYIFAHLAMPIPNRRRRRVISASLIFFPSHVALPSGLCVFCVIRALGADDLLIHTIKL
jgi:hypothetical protein